MRLLLLLSLFCASLINAQNLTGRILENSGGGHTEPLPGVNIYWANSLVGTISNADGEFAIEKTGDNFSALVISHIAYQPDTLIIKKGDEFVEIELTRNRELDDVVITAKTKGIAVKELEAIYTNELGLRELTKAACCNLSESFETNPSVDVAYSDAVTGVKQIKLLGLSGKYSRMMIENIPNMSGLASTLGLYFVPGAWMQGVQISKGTASVVNGFDAMTGQINVELKKPTDEKFYIDFYTNSILKTDVNSIVSFDVSEHLSSNLMLHGEYFGKSVDDNNDTFLDHPNVKQLNIFNRWKYADHSNWEAQLSFNYVYDQRVGGQQGFDESSDIANPYKTEITTDRFQVWSKIGYIGGEHHDKSLGFINMFTYHNQKSQFGLRNYNAKQISYYSNLIFETEIFDHDQKINAGASFSYDKFDETFINTNSISDEIVPGVFTQYTYSPSHDFSVIAGIRADFHNDYGTFATPRLHVRYSPTHNTTLRFAIGKGYKTPRVIAENISLLASSREFVFEEDLDQEETVNLGLNLTQYFTLFERELRISLEYYRTDFINKVVVDIDKNKNEVNFYNLKNDSYSNVYQFELAYEVIPNFDFLGAVRFNDVKTNYSGTMMSDPLNKELVGIITLSYITEPRSWQFDFTTQFNGKTRIPNRTFDKYSPTYTIINAQVKKIFKDWEIYAGGENLTNYTQDNPIIGYEDPFGSDFDATIIWAPTIGRMFYLGARYSIN